MSPGYSRDWSLGLFENAFWEVSEGTHLSTHTETKGEQGTASHELLLGACL